ncbi:phosphoglycerate dehydrogenase [Candidatus Viridilinea mediisalina]|uniref:D-3-phosphoglycerate dehydrogenase n=1 Tax=Candidatus Viridilinea mediisalina TaxID=2024553 RepID=A0A2A6RDM9_9CHLR|nr:phosphoglycerate dehydrogenase [Candidatus Viridilinea mediisalina]PDV99625.1 phosphoglycerate dehydrogenase [Candidatus Viridilinea mediisalina]
MDRILVTEKIAAEGLEVLKKAGSVDVRLDLDKAGLLAAIGEYDALVVRSATKVTAEVIEAGTKLRVIGRAGTGVDNIDVPAATARGIIVVNAPASNNVAVAELTIGLLVALARSIPQAHASLQSGKWERSKFVGWEVRGKTLGLVGLGRIGSEVAVRARAMEMTVLAYDPVVSLDRAEQIGVELVAMDQLLSRSDVVSLHIPLVDGTRNLFDEAHIAKMKPGAFLINASRGGIVNEDALIAAIEQGQLGGAALDVFSSEPPPSEAEIIHHPKIITVPHIGASTAEAQISAGSEVAEGVASALSGATPRYAVNAPFVAPEAWSVLQPYLNLGRQMGRLVSQMIEIPVRSYDLEFCGELADMDTQPIKLAILEGLLEANSSMRVTPVNAPLIARERGMRITERTTPHAENYGGLLTLRVQTGEGEHVFSGAVLRGEPHIVQADGYFVDFIPQGPLLFTYHRDRPGMIGRVGTLLGSADVNISGMYVGRLAPREQAMMVLTLDEPASPAVLAQVEQEEDIDRAIGVVL